MICTTAVVRRTAIRAALAAVLLAASTAACSNSRAERATAGATVPTEPPRTTTTNPYAVPPVIDAAYVNRVLAGLDAVMGDVTRALIRTKMITPDAYDRLRAIYANNNLLQLVVDVVEDDVRSGFRDYKPNPGNKTTTVSQVITSGPTCIFARVQRDFSAVSTGADAVNPQWVGLKPLEQTRDPHGYNLTSWAMVYDGFTRDRSQPANPCSG